MSDTPLDADDKSGKKTDIISAFREFNTLKGEMQA